jgi:hypothetical protein
MLSVLKGFSENDFLQYFRHGTDVQMHMQTQKMVVLRSTAHT